jgi:hypothetical protein
MAKDTTTNRNQPTPTGSTGTGKDNPGVEQVDDPIIIKGGSVSLSFDKHNFEDVTPAPPNDKNKKFSHGFNPRLTMLKIFSAGGITNIPLQSTDSIKICYEDTDCNDNVP